jgi:hypothetical protein
VKSGVPDASALRSEATAPRLNATPNSGVRMWSKMRRDRAPLQGFAVRGPLYLGLRPSASDLGCSIARLRRFRIPEAEIRVGCTATPIAGAYEFLRSHAAAETRGRSPNVASLAHARKGAYEFLRSHAAAVNGGGSPDVALSAHARKGAYELSRSYAAAATRGGSPDAASPAHTREGAYEFLRSHAAAENRGGLGARSAPNPQMGFPPLQAKAHGESRTQRIAGEGWVGVIGSVGRIKGART